MGKSDNLVSGKCYRTNDPMKSIAAIDLKHDQDGIYTHI